MLDAIDKIVHKYEFESLYGRIEKIKENASIKIAFLGEFSTGKSSLINSILGTHLPTDILPTTKAICLIEPTEGINENQFFKETDGIRTPISFSEFSEILNGEKEDVAGLSIPPCKVLPMGSIFIDTPGFHTAVGKEALQTYAYLSMIDAAVLCINIADGVINAQVMDFLTSESFRMIQNHIVFALTGSDRKSPSAGERIRESVIQQLEKAVSEGKLSIDNIEEKVFTISAKEDGNAEKICNILEKAILKDHGIICQQRQQQDSRKLAADCAEILKNLLKITKYDSDKIESAVMEQKRKLDEVAEQIRKRQDKLDDFTSTLQTKIANHLGNHIPNIQLAKSDEERMALIQEMNTGLFEMLNNEARSYLKIAQLPALSGDALGGEIMSRLKTIEQIKDFSVTVGTAVVTAWVAPAASIAGNAAEATAGAMVQRGATNAAKTAGKVSKASKFFGAVGKVLKDINPLEQVGSLIGFYAGKNALENLVSEKSAAIALQVTSSLEEPYQNDVIGPLLSQLEEEQKTLKNIQQQGDAEFEAYKSRQKEMDADLKLLSSLVV